MNTFIARVAPDWCDNMSVMCHDVALWHDCCTTFGVRSGRNGDQTGTRQRENIIKMNINKLIFSTMNIKPLADRVLIEPAEAEQKTASGIIIPDTAKEKPQRGKVVAVGAGTKDHEMTVKVGDQVLYGKYSGTEVDIDGVKYMIMKESDIYAII